MTTDLGVPESPGDLLPKGWWEDHALPLFDAMDSPDDVDEDKRRLAAVAKYVKDRDQRFELDAATRVAEIRIGELVGPPPGSGSRSDLDTVSRFRFERRADHAAFWTMKEHKPLVLRMLQDGVASRRRILAKIERDNSRVEVDDDEQGEQQLGRIELREGDFREVLDDLDGIVDAVVTDPPYPREFLPLYSDLSSVAERVLRPGGVLVAMVGHAYLPEVLARLGEHLEYRWTMAYLTGGAAATVFPRRVQTYWKPVVVFEKLPTNLNHRIGGDVIRAGGNDRDDTEHFWGQTESGMIQLIERVTSDDDLVLDPFAGGGTTLVACAALGRACIGVELDPDVVARARERIA